MRFVDQMWQNEIDPASIMEADIISSAQGRTDGRADKVKPVYTLSNSLEGGIKKEIIGNVVVNSLYGNGYMNHGTCRSEIMHKKKTQISEKITIISIFVIPYIFFWGTIRTISVGDLLIHSIN